MSDTPSVKGFIYRTTQIACPKCAYVTCQKCVTLRQKVMLICPNCGAKFAPRQG